MDTTNHSPDITVLIQDQNQTTGFWNRFTQTLRRLKTFCYPSLPQKNNPESISNSGGNEKPDQTLGETLRRRLYTVEDCDLHDILRPVGKVTWSQWHLLIVKNKKTLEITKSFQRNFENIEESSSIVDQVNIIKEIQSQFPINDGSWRNFETVLEDARLHDDPKYVVKAYTCDKNFTTRLNAHLAANAYHFIKLYCTILNCPTLHFTKDYVDAFTHILYHPKLKACRVENATVYRGAVLDDEKPIEKLEKGAIILTTTFLSTSRDRGVADAFSNPGNNDSTKISVLSKYILHNTHGCSALNIPGLSWFDEEEEVLILRYVPFKIKSIERKGHRRIEICFEQYSEEVLDGSPLESTNPNANPMHDTESRSARVGSNVSENELNSSCRCGEEIHMNTISHRVWELETNRNRITSRR